MRKQIFKNVIFSHFAAEAIRIQLESKKQELRNAYIKANKDAGQIDALENWNETLTDGIN